MVYDSLGDAGARLSRNLRGGLQRDAARHVPYFVHIASTPAGEYGEAALVRATPGCVDRGIPPSSGERVPPT